VVVEDILLQSQNDFLRQWLPYRNDYLRELLAHEARAQVHGCVNCATTEAPIRCVTCTGGHSWCKECIVTTHTNLPFHKLKTWNGSFFAPTSLFDLGFVWHLGHGGKPCPNNDAANWEDFSDRNRKGEDEEEEEEEEEVVEERAHFDTTSTTVMTLVHTTGVFTHRISWCCCPSSTRQDRQLIQTSLFPSSFTRPKTAFSFEVLEHCSADALECKTATMALYAKIRRLTSNEFPHKLPVRNCSFYFLYWFDKCYRTATESSSEFAGCGMTFRIGCNLAMVMIHNPLGQAIWHYFVQPAHSQELIYRMTGNFGTRGEHCQLVVVVRCRPIPLELSWPIV
jgi:CxC2 like cysteine cluster associated with KDZ transposases